MKTKQLVYVFITIVLLSSCSGKGSSTAPIPIIQEYPASKLEEPFENPLDKNKSRIVPNCNYGERCVGKAPDVFHTGVDYWGIPEQTEVKDRQSIFPSAPGFVVAIIHNDNAGCNPCKDHGMGNTVILKHIVADSREPIYTLYAHLEKINADLEKNFSSASPETLCVDKSTTLGIMGASGKGEQNKWTQSNPPTPHLHLEFKTFGILSNPTGSDTKFGYVSSKPPDNWGYRNPNDYIDKKSALTCDALSDGSVLGIVTTRDQTTSQEPSPTSVDTNMSAIYGIWEGTVTGMGEEMGGALQLSHSEHLEIKPDCSNGMPCIQLYDSYNNLLTLPYQPDLENPPDYFKNEDCYIFSDLSSMSVLYMCVRLQPDGSLLLKEDGLGFTGSGFLRKAEAPTVASSKTNMSAIYGVWEGTVSGVPQPITNTKVQTEHVHLEIKPDCGNDTPCAIFYYHPDTVWTLSYNPDEKYGGSVLNDCYYFVDNTEVFFEICVLPGPDGSLLVDVMSMLYSPTGTLYKVGTSTPITTAPPLNLQDPESVVYGIAHDLAFHETTTFEKITEDTLAYGTGMANGRGAIDKSTFLHELKERITSYPECVGYNISDDKTFIRIWTKGWMPSWEIQGVPSSDGLTFTLILNQGYVLMTAYFTPSYQILEPPSRIDHRPCPVINPQQSTVPATLESNIKYGRISTEVEQVKLRRTPGTSGKDDLTDLVDKISSGELVQIIGGPVQKDGLTWWEIIWNGKTGWIADHTYSGKVIIVFSS